MSISQKPSRQRRQFTDEFKAGAVRLVVEEGRSVTQVAKDLDLTASALGEWVTRAKADQGRGPVGVVTGLSGTSWRAYAARTGSSRWSATS